MISDTLGSPPPSFHEYAMTTKIMHDRTVYKTIVLPWNSTIWDLYELSKFRKFDTMLRALLRNAYENRQSILELYDLVNYDLCYDGPDAIDTKAISNLLNQPMYE